VLTKNRGRRGQEELARERSEASSTERSAAAGQASDVVGEERQGRQQFCLRSTVSDPRPSPKQAAPFPSLEERLHSVRGGLILLADVLELLALGPSCAPEDLLSKERAQAAADLCRRHARDLRLVLNDLPASLANWSPTRTLGRSRRREAKEERRT
jgi:hypothetical protein